MIYRTALKILKDRKQHTAARVREAAQVYAEVHTLRLCHLCKERYIPLYLAKQKLPCLACTQWFGSQLHSNDQVKD
jgi:hypothetical protein